MFPVQTRKLSRAIKAACLSEEFYQILDRYGYDFGPFDGGCLIVAKAIQQVIGGELWGVFGYPPWNLPQEDSPEPPRCQHAVVKIGSFYFDAAGVSYWRLLKSRWERVERCVITHSGPLPEVKFPDNLETVEEITRLIKKYVDSTSSICRSCGSSDGAGSE